MAGWTASKASTPRSHGLLAVECVEFGGLIFVRLSSPEREQGPFEAQPGICELAEPLLPQGLERAKVAYMQTYMVEAGWKVVWENNRECWHCHVGHPEYIRSHFDTANLSSADVRERIAAQTGSMVDALGGLPAGEVYDGGGLATFPAPGCSWSAHIAVEDLLPRSILYRQKLGFPTPFSRWLAGPQLDVIRKLLLEPRSMERGLFQRDAVERLFGEHREGYRDHYDRIWRLLNLELWQRVCLEKEEHEPVAVTAN